MFDLYNLTTSELRYGKAVTFLYQAFERRYEVKLVAVNIFAIKKLFRKGRPLFPPQWSIIQTAFRAGNNRATPVKPTCLWHMANISVDQKPTVIEYANKANKEVSSVKYVRFYGSFWNKLNGNPVKGFNRFSLSDKYLPDVLVTGLRSCGE